ncbi:carbonic anhydrase [Hydrogenibacillus sp. N12]|uniref:beta-class carbonic anhydrase n=1 Tax=Hydrogenibacillus sp. N12 TaxID=2866627 RepID=UPI001C7DFD65|nr:carbonic anhydrase [Hydrogenibacillus sp. N12]QZA33642.1 carbonic anhydrase [Hydrogenibacillus sp. N12]
MSLSQQIDETIQKHEAWVLRRQRGIPNNRRLFVLACMDERLDVEEMLGLQPGDAHIYRNAGGVVTDDVIRSAALSVNFFGTKEIIVINHTECGMMTAQGQEIVEALRAKFNIDVERVQLDPSLPELTLTDPGAFARWFRTFESVDDATIAQVEYLRNHPLIPKDTVINGYVYEVESHRLRRPHQRLSRRVNTRDELLGRVQDSPRGDG